MLRMGLKYFFFLFVLAVFVQVTDARLHAGVAEASVAESSDVIYEKEVVDLNHEEEKWFQTFLEGTFYTDGWDEICDAILAAIPHEQRPDYEMLVGELGEKIGREWAKNNEVRRIDNSKLIEWGDRLKGTASDEPARLAEVINTINQEVESILD